MAQLAHYGVSFKISSTVKELSVALIKACVLGHLDFIPPEVRAIEHSLKTDIFNAKERLKNERKQAIEEEWTSLMHDPRNFQMDEAQIFQDYDFTNPENTIVLHRLSEYQEGVKAWLDGAFGRLELSGDQIREGRSGKANRFRDEWKTYNGV